jgi:hypothetical protein
MIARAIPLKTDSITFKNWAPEGSGAVTTNGFLLSQHSLLLSDVSAYGTDL